MEENTNNVAEMGIVKISDDVVEVIAGIAAAEVKGIRGMSDGLVGGITQMFTGKNKKNPSKGVKVTVGEDNAVIDAYIIVEYGTKIPEIAEQVQQNVKRAVESMTGLNVSSVNVYIQNIVLPEISKPEEE